MGQALGDDGQSPLDAAVRPFEDAVVAHARALGKCGPPAQAAAILGGKVLQLRVEREHRRPLKLQLEEGGHLLEERAAEQIGIA
jgi:hypothetical protein